MHALSMSVHWLPVAGCIIKDTRYENLPCKLRCALAFSADINSGTNNWGLPVEEICQEGAVGLFDWLSLQWFLKKWRSNVLVFSSTFILPTLLDIVLFEVIHSTLSAFDVAMRVLYFGRGGGHSHNNQMDRKWNNDCLQERTRWDACPPA